MFHEVNSLVGHYEKLELCYPCQSYYSFLPFTSLLPQPVQVSCRDISSHRLCFLSCQKQTQMNLCWPRDISQLTISLETDQFSFQWKLLLTNIDAKRELWQEYKHRDYQNREKKKITASNIFNFFLLMNLILVTLVNYWTYLTGCNYTFSVCLVISLICNGMECEQASLCKCISLSHEKSRLLSDDRNIPFPHPPVWFITPT